MLFLLKNHELGANEYRGDIATVCALFLFKNHELGANEYRGDKGCLKVTCGRSSNLLYDAFIEAGRLLGYPVNNDFNGVQQEGFGRYDFTISEGQRQR